MGLREFLSWYSADLLGSSMAEPLGSTRPDLPLFLRLERILREGLKRVRPLRSLYARRYLKR